MSALREFVEKHMLEKVEADPSDLRNQTLIGNQTPGNQTTTPLQGSESDLSLSNPTTSSQSPNSLLIITDSNGKRLKPELLCPNATVKSYINYQIKEAKKSIDNSDLKANTVVVHCGTNDLEFNHPEQVIKATKSLLQSAKSKFSNSRLIYSSLLPRQDSIHENTKQVNLTIKEYCQSENIIFVDNSHISKPNQFHDHKHLNDIGLKFFAKNLKSAIYGTATSASRTRRTLRNTWPRFSHNNSLNQFGFRQPHHPMPSNQAPNRPYQVSPPPERPVHQQPYMYSQAVKSNLPVQTHIGPSSVPDLQTIIKQLQMFVSQPVR